MLDRPVHAHERDLPDRHALVDRDRQVGDVRELEREVAGEAAVHEAGGRVDQQARAGRGELLPSRRATRSSGSVTRSSVWPSTNSPGCRMNGSSPLDLHQLGEVLHRLAHVDVGVARVVEDAEAAVHPHVDARGLDQRRRRRGRSTMRPASISAPDGAVAENHGRASLGAARVVRPQRSLAQGRSTRADTGIRMRRWRHGTRPTTSSASCCPAARRSRSSTSRTPMHPDEAPPSSMPPPSRTRTSTSAPSAAPSWSTPSQWDEAGAENWHVVLRCPDCETFREGVFAQDTVEAFDEELDARHRRADRRLRRLTRANMAEEIDRFAARARRPTRSCPKTSTPGRALLRRSARRRRRPPGRAPAPRSSGRSSPVEGRLGLRHVVERRARAPRPARP